MAGRYRLDESIGQGGMGRVWRAADEMLDRPVAVKEMRMDDADAEDTRIRRERTLREARATARIDHPNVVRVYDVVEESDRLWIVMELVASRSLEQLLVEDGPLPPGEAARIGMGLVAALREVHAVGVLHRDIKPGNVLLGAGGRVVLTDFGIAAIQDAAQLTVAGMLIGSPDYMAPERVGGHPGPPSDLWSLGATLCAAVAGRSPFTRPTTLATLHAVLYEEPELPPEAGPLSELLTSLLLKNPAERPGLEEVYEALERVAAPRMPEPARYVPTLPIPTPEAPAARPDPEPPAPAPQSPENQARPAIEDTAEGRGPGACPGFGKGGQGARTNRPRTRTGPRTRTLIAATTLAALTLGTAAVILLTAQDPDGTGVSSSNTPTVAGTSHAPPPTTPRASPGTRNETGFAWAPPKAWTRSAKSPSNVHYHSPDGQQEIAASYALVRGGDLLTQWQQFERDSADAPGYRKIRLERTTFRGRPAIIWEYVFTQGGTPWRARQVGFNTGGKSYQLNVWYAAASQSAALTTYDRVTESFTPL
ncbi:serine/threonine protein kinase [Streptomyces lunaelactis]|uniref:non-specific serine/threonine protein kinase n=1 Tax=Streptomyces lunaelactis TaxID=1535768 RepID=A0A2R4T1N3_9ACTN|nr:serine/threonine protein kinase [Streptomyces lunaelactis]